MGLGVVCVCVHLSFSGSSCRSYFPQGLKCTLHSPSIRNWGLSLCTEPSSDGEQARETRAGARALGQEGATCCQELTKSEIRVCWGCRARILGGGKVCLLRFRFLLSAGHYLAFTQPAFFLSTPYPDFLEEVLSLLSCRSGN